MPTPTGQVRLCEHEGSTRCATLAAIERPRYAGFGIRATAALADALVSLGSGWLFGTIVGLLGLPIPAPLLSLAGLLIGLIFQVGFPALVGWTPGKRFLGLRIVGRNGATGGIGWPAAIVRWLGTYVSAFAFGLGYFAVLTDGEKRVGHDRFAGTHVIQG